MEEMSGILPFKIYGPRYGTIPTLSRLPHLASALVRIGGNYVLSFLQFPIWPQTKSDFLYVKVIFLIK